MPAPGLAGEFRRVRTEDGTNILTTALRFLKAAIAEAEIRPIVGAAFRIWQTQDESECVHCSVSRSSVDDLLITATTATRCWPLAEELRGTAMLNWDTALAMPEWEGVTLGALGVQNGFRQATGRA